MWAFPVAAMVLFAASLFFSNSRIFVFLNGAGLLFSAVFLIFFVQDERVVTAVPALVYWLLIALGIGIGLYSFRAKYASGHLTSAAILVFTGFITLFSIGIVLFALAVLEIGISLAGLRKRQLKA